jgi:hypothetical protein
LGLVPGVPEMWNLNLSTKSAQTIPEGCATSWLGVFRVSVSKVTRDPPAAGPGDWHEIAILGLGPGSENKTGKAWSGY